MKLNVRISAIGEKRSGTSATTGKSWAFQPITVEWNEQGQRKDGSIYTINHSLQIDLSGSAASDFKLPVGATVTIDIKFKADIFQGKTYNRIQSSYCCLCGNI